MAQLRIGDAERDAAVAALGEHYAAGRLTKPEFEERAEVAAAARFDADLAPLFADLPGARQVAQRRPVDATARPASCGWSAATPLRWWAPLALVALVALLIAIGLPWLLFLVLWFWLFAGFGGGWHRRRRWSRQPRWRAGGRPTSGHAWTAEPQRSSNPASRGADWL